MALFETTRWVLFAGTFGVGATMMAAIPTIQVRLTGLAPESRTLTGAITSPP